MAAAGTMASIERVGWRRSEPGGIATLIDREWLVTNGLGGYAAGTVGGFMTRRYHGLLVAALPNPLGRTMMLSHLACSVCLPDGRQASLEAQETAGGVDAMAAEHLQVFRLELGLPVWEYRLGDFVIERRVYFANLQNTVYVRYRLLEGSGRVRLSLRPAVDFRLHDAPVGVRSGRRYRVSQVDENMEITTGDVMPPLRLFMRGERPSFVYQPGRIAELLFRVEAARGYEASGELWSPGHYEVELGPDSRATLVASTEPWETVHAMVAPQAHEFENVRRARLADLVRAGGAAAQGRAGDAAPADRTESELALAADQFLIMPAGRIADATRARAQGEELRTVVAGYHWFTDWGRDTMISLEGLTLVTGRLAEARWILHAFAHYVRDGLIPNLFPEGSHEGVYHTADASLWYLHAVGRYLSYTDDRHTLKILLPVLEHIVDRHRKGTRFGIRADSDGLITQGTEHLPLTWMDAKCGDWVVTPRRGKPVEINALWYNALRLLAGWVADDRGEAAAAELRDLAALVQQSFNRRFWSDQHQHLYDIVDGEHGDDPALRPNQLFAVSLPHPVLARERWAPVVDACTRKLLTPVGLRSLSPDHPDYKRSYHGDLRTRDAAYHQGTVWSYLIGPYVDAWLKLNPDRAGARRFLDGLVAHLGEAGIGSVSEVFDAEPPYTPRGCVAQAWGVAELLRAWSLSAPDAPARPGRVSTPQSDAGAPGFGASKR
jgi:glycogen debranching enzyme